MVLQLGDFELCLLFMLEFFIIFLFFIIEEG